MKLLEPLSSIYKILTTDLGVLAKPDAWPGGKVPLIIEFCSHIKISGIAPTESHSYSTADLHNVSDSSGYHALGGRRH